MAATHDRLADFDVRTGTVLADYWLLATGYWLLALATGCSLTPDPCESPTPPLYPVGV